MPGLLRPVGVLHRRRKKFNSATQSFLELLLAPGEGLVPSRQAAG
jgi:hypothetical protein